MKIALFLRVALVGLFGIAGGPHIFASPPEEIRVVAYNVENYLSMERFVEGQREDTAPKPEANKASVVKILIELNADVIGLSEIGTKEDLEDLRKRLKEAGIDYPHVEYAGGSDPVRHLALLSRFPIVARDSKDDLPYQLHGRIERMQRGILDVQVDFGDQKPVRFIVVHLKSKREVPAGQALIRRNEAQILRRVVSEILAEKPDSRLVVMGDLNDTKNEPPLQEIQGEKGSATHLFDLPLVDSMGDRWTHYWSHADIYSRIDFILVNQTMRGLWDEAKSTIPRWENWREASDHRPLLAVFRLSGAVNVSSAAPTNPEP